MNQTHFLLFLLNTPNILPTIRPLLNLFKFIIILYCSNWCKSSSFSFYILILNILDWFWWFCLDWGLCLGLGLCLEGFGLCLEGFGGLRVVLMHWGCRVVGFVWLWALGFFIGQAFSIFRAGVTTNCIYFIQLSHILPKFPTSQPLLLQSPFHPNIRIFNQLKLQRSSSHINIFKLKFLLKTF